MDTSLAFALGAANRGKEMKVFDWEKAARIIKERQPQEASAGLSGDWEWTGGTIYRDGKIVDREETYTYLASTWATPELAVDGDVIGCYKMSSEPPGWDAGTYWPSEAVEILQS